MQFQVPDSEKHSKVQVTVTGETFREQILLNDNIGSCSIELPPSVDERSVSVVAQYCDDQGSPDPACEPVLLRQAESDGESSI